MVALKKTSLRKLVGDDSPVRWAAIGVLIIILGFLVLLNHTYMDPKRVFWGMLANNLSTPSVTKEVVSSSGSGSTDELTRLVFVPAPRVHNLKKYTDSSNGPTTRLNLESIATPGDVYQRYSLIDQPGLLGQKRPDYTKLYKLWLLNGGGTLNNSQIFSSGLFNLMLFGDLTSSQRNQILGYLKSHNVYTTDYSKATASKSGRHSYIYNVTINLKEWANVSQMYAKMLGLPRGSAPDPATYQAGGQAQVNLTVDTLSRQLKEIAYPGSYVNEKYGSYGVINDVPPPAHTVDIQTFQNALNAALQ